jgi:glucose-1-phosphate cytidylyltransferase
MKVIILAGGYGARLGSIAEIIPKPMVMIGNRPIIWHIMKIYSFYGFNDFVISLGYKGEAIKNFFYNYNTICSDILIDMSNNSVKLLDSNNEHNWKVALIDTGLNTLKGARIKRVEKYIDPDVNMVTYGDGVADINIQELVKFHRMHGKMVTITGVHPPARFGELIERNGRLLSFKEKPQTSVGLINGGFMVFNNELLNRLSLDEKCDLEVDVLEKLSENGEVMVYKHSGKWECVDHERDIIYLNKLWSENKAFWKVW